jgi:hypothetical protein
LPTKYLTNLVLVVLLSTIIEGCSTGTMINDNKNEIVVRDSIKSFQGTLLGNNDNGTISVDCTNAVNQSITESDSSWVCDVVLKEDTLIFGEYDKPIEKADLMKYKYAVKVILENPKVVNQNVDTRSNIIAKEIRVINSNK